MNKPLLVAIAASTLSLACDADVLATADGIAASPKGLADGTPEALGMLAFLNDSGTTFELLDDQVRLDRRAAESIIGHRNGSDGVLGEGRDDLFDSMSEVDDCYYVGPAGLARIEAWADAHDWIARDDDDLLGSWDGVEFTLGEANATLELVNASSGSYLDDVVPLDARAVDSILDARPIQTVQQLSGLYWVGHAALTRLKGHAAVPADCGIDGWDTISVYDDGDGEWREQLSTELAAVVYQTLQFDDWCGNAAGEPWLVGATLERFDCELRGATVELGQSVGGQSDDTWSIEFEVDASYRWHISSCER